MMQYATQDKLHSACAPKKMSTSSRDGMIEWRLKHTIQPIASSILIPSFGRVWPTIYDVSLCGIVPDSRASTPVQIPKQVRSKKKSTDGSCPLERHLPGGDRYFQYGTRIRKEVWINTALEIIFLAKRKSNSEYSPMDINTAFYDEVHRDLCRWHFDKEYDLNFSHVPDYASSPWPSPYPMPEEEKECGNFVPCTHCGHRTLFVGLSGDRSSPPDESSVVNTVPFFDYLDAVFGKVSLWWNSDAELIQHKETGLDIASKMEHEVASMTDQELAMFLEQAHPTQTEYNFIDEMSLNSEYRAFMTNEEETNELFFMDTNYGRE